MSREHENFSAVASSDVEDLAEAARCFVLLKQGSSATEFAAAADEVRRRRIKGAQVVAKVIENGKGEKVTHFDYRNKHRRRKTHGHRQEFTRLEIAEIKL